MKVTGKITPLRDNVIVSDMNFGDIRTASGILVPTANGKTQGIHPRWARVWAIGEKQQHVQVGDWILIEHGRWSRTVEVENEDGSITEVRMVDNNAIMMVSAEQPADMVRALD
jgi:co-chaperonin GroES (HSP10)